MATRKTTKRAVAKKPVNKKTSVPVSKPATVEVKKTPIVEVKKEKIEKPVPIVKVDKPVVNTPVEVPVPKVPKKPTPVIDKNVTVLNSMLDNYARLYNTRDTDKNLSARIGEFSRIVRYVVQTPTPKVLDRMLQFFTVETNVMMSYTNTLSYISKLSPTEREKCSTFYTVFTELVDCKKHGKRFSLDINAISSILQSDPITNFIALQINK